MNTSPILIEDDNLSNAWLQILKLLISSKDGEISPLVLSLTTFEETESIKSTLENNIREKNESSNKKKRLPEIQTVAETIFPQSIYEQVHYDRAKLYELYKKNLHRFKKLDPSNRKGTYFSRMIAFGEGESSKNQLEIIISALIEEKKSPRRSKLQAAIFDPFLDHSNSAMQGFPCLQHVTFVKTKNGGLILNSFYAIQFFYKRAYGNWLGLINLGKFVAKESGLKFERFNCFIGAEALESQNISKGEAKKLLENINAKTTASLTLPTLKQNIEEIYFEKTRA
jgi:thymidylate synthase